jgi:hypothetical protein
VSISLVFINKALLSGSTNGTTVDAPLFVTWFQCVVTVGLCVFLACGAKFFPSLGKFPELGLDVQIMLKVFIAVRLLSLCGIYLISCSYSGSSIIFGVCGHDFLQQLVPEICWCSILLHWEIPHHSIQCFDDMGFIG